VSRKNSSSASSDTSGALKVLVPVGSDVLTENELRQRAKGKVFKPVLMMATKPEKGRATGYVSGFAADIPNARYRYAIQRSPHASWLPRPLNEARVWIETNDDVVFIPFNEKESNG